MTGYQSTAAWAAAQLRRMGWRMRHLQLASLYEIKPLLHEHIQSLLDPTESLHAVSMPVISPGTVIVLKDKPKPKTSKNKMVQTSLLKYGFRVVKKTDKMQQTLLKYNFRPVKKV